MEKPVVILNAKDLPSLFPEAALKAGFNLQKFNLVLIKPNICGLYHPVTTILSGVLQHFEAYAEEVVIGETQSGMHDPREQFQQLGINRLVKEFGDKFRALDLSEDRAVIVKVPRPHALKEIELPEKVLKADILINIPKVGTHHTTKLTNALKNLFGLLPSKHKHSCYHPLGMDNVIADIAQVVKTDLNIVDAGQKVIVGTDPLTVDVVACRFVNLDPFEVRHLELVSKDCGMDLESVIRQLRIVAL